MSNRVTCWVVEDYGEYRDVLKPSSNCPSKTQSSTSIVVDVQATGVNFSDVLAIAGKYQVKHSTPFVPGAEVAGYVVDPGNSSFKIGDAVLCYSENGGFAQTVAVDPQWAFKINQDMPMTDAAAMLITYQTSFIALQDRGTLKSGEVLLVHSGAGGVGTAAIQIGKILGATVVATAGTPEKLEVCKQCGADHVINYREENFIDKIKEITDGRGADVIYDPVGGDTFDHSTRCIAWDGRLIVVGFASGRIPEIAANRIMLKNIAITGINWPGYRKQNPQRLQQAHQTLMDWYKSGKINPVVCEVVSFTEVPRALDLLLSRESFGKVVVLVE